MYDQTPVAVIGVQKTSATWEKGTGSKTPALYSKSNRPASLTL